MLIKSCIHSVSSLIGLKEHILVAGRSGSGKTNLVFMLMDGMIRKKINVLALDWKRGVSRFKITVS